MKPRSVWMLGISMILTVAVPPLDAGRSPAEHLALGKHALAAGKHRQAISAFERAAVDEELRSQALQGLARAQFERGWPTRALETASEAVAAANAGMDRAQALNARGTLRLRHGMRSTRPVTNPKQAGAVFDAGYLAFEQAAGDFEAALDEAGAEVPELLLNLATGYARLGRFRDAGDVLERHRALDSEAAEAADLSLLLTCLTDALGELPNLDGVRAREDVEGPRKISSEGGPSLRLTAGRRSGVAIFQAVIDREGRLHCAWPLWNEGFTEESIGRALLDLSRWRFEPAVLDGAAVVYPQVLTLSVGRP